MLALRRRFALGSTLALGFVLLIAVPVDGAAARLSWSRVEPSAFGASTPEAIATGPRGLVAVGSASTGSGFEAAIWLSTNARTWTRVDLGSDGQSVVLHAVVAWRSGYAAVGIRSIPAPNGGRLRSAVAFTTRDGRHWRMADVGDAAAASLDAVTVHDGVLVAGGCFRLSSFGCLFSKNATAAIWSSRDGRTWTRQILPNGQHSRVVSVRSIDGILAAVGGEFSVDGDTSSPITEAIWLGKRPADLVRQRTEDFDPGASAADAVALRGRLTVLAWWCFGTIQPDGSVWREDAIDTTDLCGDLGGEVTRATVLNGAIYATGDLFSDAYDSPLPIWTSTDRRHWSLIRGAAFVPHGSSFYGLDVVAWHGRLVVLGLKFDGIDQHGEVWIGSPES